MKAETFSWMMGAGLLAGATLSAAPAAQPSASWKAGRAGYEQHCAACHGIDGDGQGPATIWLFPRPRNFNSALFKIQSSPAGSLPTDEDLFNTITRGMPGSSMPSFSYLSEADRHAVVEYIKHLSAEIREDGSRVDNFAQAEAAGQLRGPIPVPPEPPLTIDALVKGREVYARLQCAVCHGEQGQGDGPSAATLKDNWGLPLPARDFSIGAFRGGSEGRDLYLRIANGMAGTPMLAFDDSVVTPDERWALVHYIQSLRRKDAEVHDILKPEDADIRVSRVRRIWTGPMDPGWETLDSVRVPLNPLWPEPYPISAVAITAVHDGRRIAILAQWKDAIPNGAPIRAQDFQDGMALQFALTPDPPFLGMGDASHPVNLWYWRAGWQQETDGARPDIDDKYASMHVDTYFATEYRTAADAGNVLATPKRSPVEDATARGFGTLKPQPPKQQNVDGAALWRDGFWSVVFVRNLRSRERDDAQFILRKDPVPVAFAVWNGDQRDRNGRKVISNWYRLVLEP